MRENKKGLIFLIVILIILISGLLTYINYDNVLLNKTKVEKENISTTTTNKKNYDIELKDLNFPTKNDDSVLFYGNVDEFIDEDIKKSLELGSDYKNVVYEINGFNFEESCTEYLEQNSDGPSYCENSEMTINGKIKINFSLGFPSEQKFIIITAENVIVQKGAGPITLGDIEIYDYEGNMIKKIETTTNYLILHGDNCEILYDSNREYNIKLVDNKIHYIDASERAIYKTFDLKTFEENIIGTINASTSQQC